LGRRANSYTPAGLVPVFLAPAVVEGTVLRITHIPAALQICVDASVRAPLNVCPRVRRRFPVIRRVVAGDSNLRLNPAFFSADDFDRLIFLAPGNL
jgi:hypothetical protein